MARSTQPKPGEMMLPSRWAVTDADRALFRRELRAFVPPDAFDVHAHLYPLADIKLRRDDADVGLATYRHWMRAFMGDRAPRDGLFFGAPLSAQMDVAATNRFVFGELRRRPNSRGLLLVRPQDDPAAVEAEVVRTGAAGFKVYYVFLDRADANQASIDEYVPRWMWEIADRHGLVILIHLVRSRALADPVNQRSLRRHCTRFANARVILAHAARGFNPQHTIDGIASLAGLDNAFFDTSAICESDALLAILRRFGSSRLMFGSDFPVAAMRGRAVGVGDGFAWFMAHSLDWSKAATAPPTLVGIESLLAIRRAATLGGLKDGDVEAIFGDNARSLLGLNERAGAAPSPPRRGRGLG